MALALRLLEHNVLAVNEMRSTNGINASAGAHHLRGPITREQVVDQYRHVADVDVAVLVSVGTTQADTRSIAGQQVIDQVGHVANVDAAVVIHVAAHKRAAGIEFPAFVFGP